MGAQAERIRERLRKHVEQIFKALTLEIDRELRISTPVDTGFARANWVPSVGSPELTDLDAAAATMAHAAGVAGVLRFKLGDGALWVSNGVSYIQILNYGTSQQAPAMWIEAAVDRAVATISARYNVSIDIDRPTGAEGLASSYSPMGDS